MPLSLHRLVNFDRIKEWEKSVRRSKGEKDLNLEEKRQLDTIVKFKKIFLIGTNNPNKDISSKIDSRLVSKEAKIKEYEFWRDLKINESNVWCNEIQNDENNVNPYLISYLELFPSCIHFMTKQMCRCDESCTDEKMKKLFYDKNCYIYKFDPIVLHSCQYMDKKISNGLLVNFDFFTEKTLIKKKMKKRIRKLCDNKHKSYDKAICLAYEVFNDCGDDLECYKLDIENFDYSSCKNPEIHEQIDSIKEIIPYSFTKQSRNKREVNEGIGNYHNPKIILYNDQNKYLQSIGFGLLAALGVLLTFGLTRNTQFKTKFILRTGILVILSLILFWLLVY